MKMYKKDGQNSVFSITSNYYTKKSTCDRSDHRADKRKELPGICTKCLHESTPNHVYSTGITTTILLPHPHHHHSPRSSNLCHQLRHLSLGAALSVSDRVQTTLDGVDQDPARLEEWVRSPSTDELWLTTSWEVIILWVDIEETGLGDARSGRIALDGAEIKDAEPGAVVGLVGPLVDDVLVVVDGANLGLVVAGLLGGGEVGNVPDVGDGEAVVGGGLAVLLVELVIHDEELLVVGVEDPALVGVGGAGVGGAGDDGGVGAVSDVVDGEGVFVVAVADFLAVEAGVGTLVFQALSVVDVAVLGGAARGGWVGGVLEVDEDEAGLALRVARSSADGNGVVALFWANDDVVGLSWVSGVFSNW